MSLRDSGALIDQEACLAFAFAREWGYRRAKRGFCTAGKKGTHGVHARLTKCPNISYLSPVPAGTARDGSGRLGTARDGSGRLGTARDGSGRLGTLGTLGTARDGSGRLGTARDGWRDLRTVGPGGVFSDKGQWSPSKEG